jgi:hypothetical protein
MSKLEVAIRIVEWILGILVVMLVGYFLGRKLGGRRLMTWVGIAALITVVAFAVNAAIVLA